MGHEKLHQLLYVSRASRPLSEEDLHDIRDAGMRHNEESQVYGVLLYRGGTFLQLLEGPRDAVEDTYARIRQDRRHTDVRVLYRGECGARNYYYYNMGVIVPSDLNEPLQRSMDRIMDHADAVAQIKANPDGTPADTESSRPVADMDIDSVLEEIVRRFASLEKAA